MKRYISVLSLKVSLPIDGVAKRSLDELPENGHNATPQPHVLVAQVKHLVHQ
jgi:hypothetical protein